MKTYVTYLASIAGLLTLQPAFASPSTPTSVWPEASALVQRCASQTICIRQDGSRLASPLKSVCPELVIDGTTARFTLHGKTYVANITESEDSDGGDLNDLTLSDADGNFAENHHNVLGFDDVLLTLLGGNAERVRTAYMKCAEGAK